MLNVDMALFPSQHGLPAEQKNDLFIQLQAHNLFPNQIFRRLILINGAFNVIFPLNIQCNVAAPTESSKRKTLVFPFLPFLAPLFSLHTLLFFSFLFSQR